MTWSYYVYGLGLVADRPIPGLIPVNGLRAFDVKVSLEGGSTCSGRCREPSATLWHVSSNRDARGEPVLQVWRVENDGSFRFRYSDGVEFGVDRRGARVWASGSAGATPEDLDVYLLGPVLGFVLRLRGITCLHASAVMADTWALAFPGPAGAGKSTLAAAFALSGCPVLADDVLPLREADGHFLAGPGIPRLCLWPDAVGHLYGSPEALPRLTPDYALDPTWDKRWLDLAKVNPQFFRKAPPLGVIYFLGERQAAADFRVEAISPGEGLMMLVANSYRTELLNKDLRAREFATLARLAAQVPLRRVTPPDDPARLSGLCEAILEDFRGLNTPAFRQKTPLG
ncbi:MAG: hypothetical protein FJ121_00785 [Deltaproteobacteria bacterium]|nr:hypothetical protein [Deltaproteobacteria bacterium]